MLQRPSSQTVRSTWPLLAWPSAQPGVPAHQPPSPAGIIHARHLRKLQAVHSLQHRHPSLQHHDLQQQHGDNSALHDCCGITNLTLRATSSLSFLSALCLAASSCLAVALAVFFCALACDAAARWAAACALAEGGVSGMPARKREVTGLPGYHLLPLVVVEAGAGAEPFLAACGAGADTRHWLGGAEWGSLDLHGWAKGL
jgi:hypothetical protein